jgi:hypothetical protein
VYLSKTALFWLSITGLDQFGRVSRPILDDRDLRWSASRPAGTIGDLSPYRRNPPANRCWTGKSCRRRRLSRPLPSARFCEISNTQGRAPSNLSTRGRRVSERSAGREWARLELPIPPARPGGRPRKTDMRAAVNAILLQKVKAFDRYGLLVRPGPAEVLRAADEKASGVGVDEEFRDRAGREPLALWRTKPL